MELWNILDENGNPTGVTLDKNDKRAWEKGAYHQGVDAWIINSENKILIQKRAPQKKREPNVWSMTVGGSVIKGESIMDALKRETKEELGIELNDEQATKIQHYKLPNLWLDVYLVKQDVNLEDIKLRKEEVADAKFATFDEIEQIYKNNMFMKNRWEYVREDVKKFINKEKD